MINVTLTITGAKRGRLCNAAAKASPKDAVEG